MSLRELAYDRRRLERLRRGGVLVVSEPAVLPVTVTRTTWLKRPVAELQFPVFSVR